MDACGFATMPRRKADAPTRTDCAEAVAEKKPRAKRVLHAGSPAAPSLFVDQQQSSRQEQQPRQVQQQQHAGTKRPKAEEDAPSKASTLVLAASPSPSRLTSPDVARAADAVAVSSTAGSAAAPPQPKRQRSRKDGVAAPRASRRSAALPASDPGVPSTSNAAPAVTMVPPAVPSLLVDQQQSLRQEQQSRQVQQQQHAGTKRPKAEEDAPSEASTLVLAASPSPSRLTSPDVARAADAVAVSSTAGSAVAPPQPKRQRSRKDGVAAPRASRRSAAPPASDPGVPSTSTAAPAVTMVQHATVSPKTGRAKRTVARCHRVFSTDIFVKLAGDAREAFAQDLANRRFQYPLPFIGNLVCEFIGKTADKNCHEIVATDAVVFRWSYTCTPKPGVEIKGFSDSHYPVRNIAVGDSPPRTARVMLDAIVLAKIYEKLSPDRCPFVRKYCSRHGQDLGGCEIISIGFPKPLSKMPSIEEFIDESGAGSKWILCACIGDTNKWICHPGTSARYSTNRFTYRVSELRVFSITDKKEATPESFKLRKRTAIRKDKPYPATLQDVNSGAHRGVRDVIAYGAALAEFELAKHEGGRNVSVANAMQGFDLDPFAWEDSAPGSNMVVLWRSPDAKHHLQTGNLRYLLGLIAKSAEGQETEATDSIIEVI